MKALLLNLGGLPPRDFVDLLAELPKRGVTAGDATVVRHKSPKDLVEWLNASPQISVAYERRGYDALVILLSADDSAGLAFSRLLREAGLNLPLVVMLHVESEKLLSGAETRAALLNEGANYCISFVERFSLDELVAVVGTAVRHSYGVLTGQRIEFAEGEFVLETARQRVSNIKTGERVALTSYEYDFLEELVLRQGTTVTREMLLNRLYAGKKEPELKIIDVYACKLRKKLGKTSCRKEHKKPEGIIRTVWGRGYVLDGLGDKTRRADRLPQMLSQKPIAAGVTA